SSRLSADSASARRDLTPGVRSMAREAGGESIPPGRRRTDGSMDDHGAPARWWPALGPLAVGIVTLPTVFGLLACSGGVCAGHSLLHAAAERRPNSERRGEPPAADG